MPTQTSSKKNQPATNTSVLSNNQIGLQEANATTSPFKILNLSKRQFFKKRILTETEWNDNPDLVDKEAVLKLIKNSDNSYYITKNEHFEKNKSKSLFLVFDQYGTLVNFNHYKSATGPVSRWGNSQHFKHQVEPGYIIVEAVLKDGGDKKNIKREGILKICEEIIQDLQEENKTPGIENWLDSNKFGLTNNPFVQKIISKLAGIDGEKKELFADYKDLRVSLIKNRVDKDKESELIENQFIIYTGKPAISRYANPNNGQEEFFKEAKISEEQAKVIKADQEKNKDSEKRFYLDVPGEEALTQSQNNEILETANQDILKNNKQLETAEQLINKLLANSSRSQIEKNAKEDKTKNLLSTQIGKFFQKILSAFTIHFIDESLGKGIGAIFRLFKLSDKKRAIKENNGQVNSVSTKIHIAQPNTAPTLPKK